MLKRAIRVVAADTDLWTDATWVVDSTPVERGRSRPMNYQVALHFEGVQPLMLHGPWVPWATVAICATVFDTPWPPGYNPPPPVQVPPQPQPPVQPAPQQPVPAVAQHQQLPQLPPGQGG